MTKPRNAGTWSESRYWQQVRSHLRNAFKFSWKPIQNCKNEARRKSQSDNKRLKYEYQCAECTQWHAGKDTQVDHIVAVGSLKCMDDLVPFLERLTSEDGYRLLCKPCHQTITNKEREDAKLDK